MEKSGVTSKARVHMKTGFWTKVAMKKVTVVRFSILIAFLTFLTAMALHLSGPNGSFGSGRTVYRVNISTGEITVGGAQVVGSR